jgi:hypothetical protein
MPHRKRNLKVSKRFELIFFPLKLLSRNHHIRISNDSVGRNPTFQIPQQDKFLQYLNPLKSLHFSSITKRGLNVRRGETQPQHSRKGLPRGGDMRIFLSTSGARSYHHAESSLLAARALFRVSYTVPQNDRFAMFKCQLVHIYTKEVQKSCYSVSVAHVAFPLLSSQSTPYTLFRRRKNTRYTCSKRTTRTKIRQTSTGSMIPTHMLQMTNSDHPANLCGQRRKQTNLCIK